MRWIFVFLLGCSGSHAVLPGPEPVECPSDRFRDGDGDGFGDPSLCDPGGVEDATDCDDNNAGVHPAAPLICFTGVDESCGTDDQSCRLTGSVAASDVRDAELRFEHAGPGQGRLSTGPNGELVASTQYRQSPQETAAHIFDSEVFGQVLVRQADASVRVPMPENTYQWDAALTPDLNRNGILDLVVSDFRSGLLHVFTDPRTTDRDETTLLEMPGARALQTGDFDGDGDGDLWFSSYAIGVSSRPTRGVGSLVRDPLTAPERLDSSPPQYQFDGQAPIALGDINGNGVPDVGYFSQQGLGDFGRSSYRSTFLAFEGTAPSLSPSDAIVRVSSEAETLYDPQSAIAAGPVDLNGDGVSDLVLNGVRTSLDSNPVFVFLCPCDGDLRLADADAQIEIPQGVFTAPAVTTVGDFDGDGNTDLLVSGSRLYYGPVLGVVAAADADLVFELPDGEHRPVRFDIHGGFDLNRDGHGDLALPLPAEGGLPAGFAVIYGRGR